MRRLIPALLLPLWLLASVLAQTPWLRSFPVDIAGAPLLGGAALGVLVPVLTVRSGIRVWLGALVDIAAFVVFTLVIVLRDPVGLSALVQALYHGPSQILTYALPLVSPRSLMVAPVALSWLVGALAGECWGRQWTSVLPYVGVLGGFGLACAGSQRAAGSDPGAAQLRETLLGAALLATVLLLRTAQAWVNQESIAESTQPDGILPTRGFVIGLGTTVVIALTASLIVQNDAFPRRAAAPQRVPSINDSKPLAPVSFIAGLRPSDSTQVARELFTVTLDRRAPGYFAIANVDVYDGAGWSFDRTFRPSGGVVPADADAALRTGAAVGQTYRITAGPMSDAPWMPMLYRPSKVTGALVDIDAASGMVVPVNTGSAGTYAVQSTVPSTMFTRIKAARSSPDAATAATDDQIPATLRATLDRLIKDFVVETGVPSAPALPFLQALQRDLQRTYTLSGAARGSATGTLTPSSSAAPSGRSASTTPNPAGERAGGTSFADVLASILGSERSGTPEQFATLVALVARTLGVPARLVTGFRVRTPSGGTELSRGNYVVRASAAWTWVEIPINGQGWVVLDAAPGDYSATARPPESGAASSPSSSAPPSQNASLASNSGGHAIAKRSSVPHPASNTDEGLLIALLIAAGLVVLLLLLVLGSRKRVRASRRRGVTDARTQLLGAWQESIDMLIESGLPRLTSFTSAEVAELTGAQFGAVAGEQAAGLAASANSVAFSTLTLVRPEEVDEAWAAQRNLQRSVRQQLGVRERIAAAIRYHRDGGSRVRGIGAYLRGGRMRRRRQR